MIEQIQKKISDFSALTCMVDFCRPGHILDIAILNLAMAACVASYNIMNNFVHHYDLGIIPVLYKSSHSKLCNISVTLW